MDLLELLFAILEPILQVLGEVLIDACLNTGPTPSGLATPGEKQFARFVVWLMAGLCVGGISVLLFPHQLMRWPTMRVANVLLTPVIGAWLLSVIGKWREKRGKSRSRMERFANAWVFGFAVAFMRWTCCRTY